MAEKRKGYATEAGQAEANKRYRDKNKEHRNYLSARSGARSFIRNKAKKEDLLELQDLIEKKLINSKIASDLTSFSKKLQKK